MSPLSRLLEELDLGGLRCAVTRRNDSVVIDRDDGMQVVVRDAGSELVEVAYEQALHDTACETCSPAIAAALLRAVLSRRQLERVPLPKA